MAAATVKPTARWVCTLFAQPVSSSNIRNHWQVIDLTRCETVKSKRRALPLKSISQSQLWHWIQLSLTECPFVISQGFFCMNTNSNVFPYHFQAQARNFMLPPVILANGTPTTHTHTIGRLPSARDVWRDDHGSCEPASSQSPGGFCALAACSAARARPGSSGRMNATGFTHTHTRRTQIPSR